MKMYLTVESPLQLAGNKKVIAKRKQFKFTFKVCSMPCREYSKDVEEVLKILDMPSSQWQHNTAGMLPPLYCGYR